MTMTVEEVDGGATCRQVGAERAGWPVQWWVAWLCSLLLEPVLWYWVQAGWMFAVSGGCLNCNFGHRLVAAFVGAGARGPHPGEDVWGGTHHRGNRKGVPAQRARVGWWWRSGWVGLCYMQLQR